MGQQEPALMSSQGLARRRPGLLTGSWQVLWGLSG